MILRTSGQTLAPFSTVKAMSYLPKTSNPITKKLKLMKINWKTGIIALATFATLTPISSALGQQFDNKASLESINTTLPSTGNNNVNNLDGTWDFQVNYPESQCSIQGYCSIKIVGGIGRYASPTDNDSVFLVNIYPTTINRGQPVVSITQIGTTGLEVHYTAVLSGRLDQPGLITGRFVDVVDNQATFSLKKK